MNQHVRLTRLRKLSKSLHDQFHKIHHKLIEISHSGEALVLIICSKTCDSADVVMNDVVMKLVMNDSADVLLVLQGWKSGSWNIMEKLNFSVSGKFLQHNLLVSQENSTALL